MIAAEAATYSAGGCVIGCIFGVLLQKVLITKVLTAVKIAWSFPLLQIVCVIAMTFLVTWLSIKGPLNRIKTKGISEIVGSL
jgi:putative ABC transport system permease protein